MASPVTELTTVPVREYLSWMEDRRDCGNAKEREGERKPARRNKKMERTTMSGAFEAGSAIVYNGCDAV